MRIGSAILIAILLLMFISTNEAYSGRTVKALGGSDDEVIYSSIRTSDGGYAMTGFTTSYGPNGKNVLVIKVDSCDEVLWTRAFGGGDDEEGRCIIETHDDGLVIAGYTESVSGQFDKLLLSKFNSSGTHQWSKAVWRDSAILVSRLNFDAYSVIQDSDSNLVVTGYMYRVNMSRNSLFLAKFNSSGDLLRMRTVFNSVDGNRHHYGRSVVEMCDDSGYLVVGYSDDPQNDENVLLTKFDSNGDLDYGRYMDGGGDERAYSVIRTYDCGFAFTGISDDSLFLVKKTSTLGASWEKIITYNKTAGYGLTEISFDSALIVAGSYATSTATDILLARWEKNGTCDWRNKFGGINSELAYDILERPKHNLVGYGLTDGYGAGNDDVLLAISDSTGRSCLTTMGFINSTEWNPTEGPIQALSNWTPGSLDTLEWTDLTVAEPSISDTVVCDISQRCGDANGDETVNVSDAVYIINYVFVGGDAPVPLACGDANSDGTVNVSDAVYIINYVFVGGGAPEDCTPGSGNWTDGDCCPFLP